MPTTSEVLGTALITGASSGIGAVYSDRLAKRGYDLILVARDRERLNELAHQLRQSTRRSVQVFAVDLTNGSDLKRVEQILRSETELTMLVNNAGFGSTARLLEANSETMEEMIRLNVIAATRLVYAAAPEFISRNRGTIINISSIVAIAPEILNGVYGGTKAFLLALSQSLKHELAGSAVRIQAVLPGGTKTNFFNVAGTPLETMPQERQEQMMATEDLVDSALAGLDMGEFITIPTLPDVQDWERYEAARQNLIPHLRESHPADRYRRSDFGR